MCGLAPIPFAPCFSRNKTTSGVGLRCPCSTLTRQAQLCSTPCRRSMIDRTSWTRNAGATPFTWTKGAGPCAWSITAGTGGSSTRAGNASPIDILAVRLLSGGNSLCNSAGRDRRNALKLVGSKARTLREGDPGSGPVPYQIRHADRAAASDRRIPRADGTPRNQEDLCLTSASRRRRRARSDVWTIPILLRRSVADPAQALAQEQPPAAARLSTRSPKGVWPLFGPSFKRLDAGAAPAASTMSTGLSLSRLLIELRPCAHVGGEPGSTGARDEERGPVRLAP